MFSLMKKDIEFIIENDPAVSIKESIRFKDYLQSNFVGFLTENNSCVSLRNIDPNSEFRYSRE